MEPTVTQKTHFILRFWRPSDNKTFYARNAHNCSGARNWCYNSDRSLAYRFNSRTDARRTVKSTSFVELLDPTVMTRDGYKSLPTLTYYWEVLKIVETISVTTEESILVSNAPEMTQIARAMD